jgi:hypothetical protein
MSRGLVPSEGRASGYPCQRSNVDGVTRNAGHRSRGSSFASAASSIRSAGVYRGAPTASTATWWPSTVISTASVSIVRLTANAQRPPDDHQRHSTNHPGRQPPSATSPRVAPGVADVAPQHAGPSVVFDRCASGTPAIAAAGDPDRPLCPQWPDASGRAGRAGWVDWREIRRDLGARRGVPGRQVPHRQRLVHGARGGSGQLRCRLSRADGEGGLAGAGRAARLPAGAQHPPAPPRRSNSRP